MWCTWTFWSIFRDVLSVDCAFVVMCLLCEWSIWIGVGMLSSFRLMWGIMWWFIHHIARLFFQPPHTFLFELNCHITHLVYTLYISYTDTHLKPSYTLYFVAIVTLSNFGNPQTTWVYKGVRISTLDLTLVSGTE